MSEYKTRDMKSIHKLVISVSDRVKKRKKRTDADLECSTHLIANGDRTNNFQRFGIFYWC